MLSPSAMAVDACHDHDILNSVHEKLDKAVQLTEHVNVFLDRDSAFFYGNTKVSDTPSNVPSFVIYGTVGTNNVEVT
jgi:hypothetical protein